MSKSRDLANGNEGSEGLPKGGRRSIWRRRRLNASALLGLAIVLVVVIAGLAAPALAPYPATEQHIQIRLKPPSWLPGGESGFLLGTDTLGRDILSRIIYGARISLIVGASSILISGAIGIFLGLIAAFYQKWGDPFLSILADIQQSIPPIALIIAFAAAIGPGLRNVILILGVTGWVVYYRVMRAETLSVRHRIYVEAARALGGKDSWIILRHILPNVSASILVIATLLLATVITSEAALSFLGLGIPPTIPTWGNMIAEGREYLTDAWWLPVFPGVAISLTVLGINLLGDWLRDVFDPRRSFRRG